MKGIDNRPDKCSICKRGKAKIRASLVIAGQGNDGQEMPERKVKRWICEVCARILAEKHKQEANK